MPRLAPHDVFTPAVPVREDMFATRRHARLQERVEDAISEPGRQLVVYGPTGVGKTSLVRHVAAQGGITHIRVECGGSFDELMRDALAKMLDEQVVEEVRKTSRATDIGASLYALITAKASRSTASEVKVSRLSPSLPSMVADAMTLRGVRFLFLDNFENLQNTDHYVETSIQISRLFKMFADRSADSGVNLKVVLAGIPSASGALIAVDSATARRTAQIEVGKMPADELDQILQRGERKLDIKFEGFTGHRIINESDGFPYYTHLYALHCSRRTIRDGRRNVRLEDFEQGLEDIINDCDLALRESYRAAVETSGEVKTRKTIMEAVAINRKDEVTFKEIREGFLAIRPGYGTLSRLNFLSPAIKSLKGDYHILADAGKPKSAKHTYRFSNPLMRAYVQLRRVRDKQLEGEPLPFLPLSEGLDAVSRS